MFVVATVSYTLKQCYQFAKVIQVLFPGISLLAQYLTYAWTIFYLNLSTLDSQVCHYTHFKDFWISDGKYYLEDAGFPSYNACLVEFYGTRYYLKVYA